MLMSILQIGALAYLGLAALLYFSQDALVFQAGQDRHHAVTPAAAGLKFAEIMARTDDGETLHGWHVPAADKARGLVILFHGNAGNIGHRIDYLRMFHDLGYASLILDYRGYGRSSGTPSEEGTYRDSEAAWIQASKVLGYSADRIVLFGESLGGAVAARLAATKRPAALVLASTFTSVPDLRSELYPWLPVRYLARVRYDTLGRLGDIKAPLLIIHSPHDEVIPYAHGRRLFAAAHPPKDFLEISGGHNEGFVFGRTEWTARLGGFLDRAIGRERDQSPLASPQ